MNNIGSLMNDTGSPKNDAVSAANATASAVSDTAPAVEDAAPALRENANSAHEQTPALRKNTNSVRKQANALREQAIRPPGGQLLDFTALRAAELEPWRPYLYGNRFGSVLALKGCPGAAEQAGKPPFFGPDAAALESALASLGWGNNNWCGVVLELPGKPGISASDLRLLIETVDPLALLALDKEALLLVRRAFGEAGEASRVDEANKPDEPDEGKSPSPIPTAAPLPSAGKRTNQCGRVLVFVESFEAALESKGAKQRAWRQLKALRP